MSCSSDGPPGAPRRRRRSGRPSAGGVVLAGRRPGTRGRPARGAGRQHAHLRPLLAAGSHRLTYWNTDWRSQTGAGVCGILHGDNAGILGYRFYEKDRDHVVVCGNPEDAAYLEGTHSDGRGLLAVDGAGHGNLFTGDAPHISLTMSAAAALRGAQRRRGRARDGLAAATSPTSPPGQRAAHRRRLPGRRARESPRHRQRRAGVVPRMDRGGLPVRARGDHGDRPDIVVAAVLEDMLPAGPACTSTCCATTSRAPLRHRAVRHAWPCCARSTADRPAAPAPTAPRRYHVSASPTTARPRGCRSRQRFGETIEELLGRLCGRPRAVPADPAVPTSSSAGHPRSPPSLQVGAVLHEASGGPIARRLRARIQRATSSRAAHPVTDVARSPGAPAGSSCVRAHRDDLVHPARRTGLAGYDGASTRSCCGPGRPRRRGFRAGPQRRAGSDGVRPRRRAAAGRRDHHPRTRWPTTVRTPPTSSAASTGSRTAPTWCSQPLRPGTDDATAVRSTRRHARRLVGPQFLGFLMSPAQLPAPPPRSSRGAPAPGAGGL